MRRCTTIFWSRLRTSGSTAIDEEAEDVNIDRYIEIYIIILSRKGW